MKTIDLGNVAKWVVIFLIAGALFVFFGLILKHYAII